MTLSPSPASINAGTTSTVGVTVDLTGMTGKTPALTDTVAILGGYQIRVDFDNARLRLDDVTGGSAAEFASRPTFTTLSTANANGRVTIVAAQTSSNTPSGRVQIAKLIFTAKSGGTASLTPLPLSLSSANQCCPSAGPTSIVATGVAASITINGGVPGDANGDGSVGVADVFYLINYLFAAGPAPIGPADPNADGSVTVSDVFYLINFLFAGGPSPR